MTNYNDGPTIRPALDSILRQIDDRFEIVVVDNYSTDGSRELLEQYATAGKVNKVVKKRCSIGAGKQFAVENSSAEYIIADLDMDDEFRQDLQSLLDFYHEKCEGKILAAIAEPKSSWTTNVTIAPKSLVLELGGWPDLQMWEDSNLWGRAAKIGKYAWTSFSLAGNVTSHPERRSALGKIKFDYMRYREWLRTGMRGYPQGKRIRYRQLPAYLLARIAYRFYKSYKENTNLDFSSRNSTYFVQYTQSTNEIVSEDKHSIRA